MKWNPAALDALSKGDLKNAMVAATPGGIEAQEHNGQKEFVANETLPKECPREELEQLGFIFGESDDDIFIKVQFPLGWSMQPDTNFVDAYSIHSIWTHLIDNDGRIRGGIFYKAVCCDKSACMMLYARYSFESERDDNYNVIAYIVTDYDEEIWCIKGYWKSDDVSYNDNPAANWLNKHFPEWKNVLAYW